MRKTAAILLVLFLLLSAGCTDRKEPDPTVPETAPPATESQIPSETQAPPTEPVTEPEKETVPETDPVDISTTATPTESGKCLICGAPENDYDGYCYYCHPDFLFTCTRCGYEQPYHRTESGMCYECEAAVDANTGATPYGS